MKVLAIASGGGHWEQLMLLRPAFVNSEVKYVTTLPGLPEREGIENFSIVSECNRGDVFKTALNVFKLLNIIFRFKPNVVVSTGALPGLIAIVLAKRLLKTRTVWIDSVANGHEFSMSGKLAKNHCDLWVSQWEEVATEAGARYLGRVI